jgi:hypothetical protein
MGVPDPVEFSSAWEAAWNAHDLDAVLAHFADKVVFYSPYAAQVLPETGGVLHCKDELRRYWEEGLRLVPDLRFAVEGVNAGVSSLVLHYRNQRDVLVDEVLIFDDAGLVTEGHGTYPTTIPASWHDEPGR